MLMYDFHYNFIKKIFDANLLFTDTDSLFMKWNQKLLWRIVQIQTLAWLYWISSKSFWSN